MVLEGGTLTSSAGAWSSPLVRPVLGRAGNVVEIGWLVVGTLLGPEGAGNRELCRGSPVLVPPRLPWEAAGPAGRLGSDRSYVENCTVDASIF